MTSVLPTLLSCHNWNTLFMGPNAVADAIAQKYNATKSQVFDHVSEWSGPRSQTLATVLSSHSLT